MSSYNDQPCSLAPTQAFVPIHPKVVEDTTTPQKLADFTSDPKRKAFLSAPNPRKEIPLHPGLRQKTIAFGKTVNFSQTVEATSRAAKKAMSTTNSATSSPMQAHHANVTENKENREDFLKIIQDELAATRREIQEENAKKQEELNEQNLKKMQEMMSSFFQQIAVNSPAKEKESAAPPRPVNKITLARQKIQRECKIPPEALPILEQRLKADPTFRRTIDDVLADAEYESEHTGQSTRDYSPTSVSTGYAPYTGGANPAQMMRETLTVERSVRFDNGLESVDQRTKTTHWNGQDRYRGGYSDDLHSVYQPGSSVSYYPSAVAPKRGNDYYVDHVEEVESDIEEYHPDRRPVQRGSSKEERERRIREKYAYRK